MDTRKMTNYKYKILFQEIHWHDYRNFVFGRNHSYIFENYFGIQFEKTMKQLSEIREK